MPERHVAHEFLDVHAPVAERPALPVRLGDRCLEGDDAFEPRHEIGHVLVLRGPCELLVLVSCVERVPGGGTARWLAVRVSRVNSTLQAQ